ncbi:hypothetical protein NW759_016528 [Fusarium solani]|nr:hypothetical protein NW759_016528 [Fusarium solani]
MATLNPLEEGQRVLHDTLTPKCPETADIRLNHTMLRVADPARSIRFYADIFGMSLIFRFAAGPITVYYLGHASPDDKIPADMARGGLGTKSGLLELVHVHEEQGAADLDGAAHLAGTPEGRFGFGHLGFNVPDVDQVLERARQQGYSVLKTRADTSERKLDLPRYVPEGSFHPSFLVAYTQVGFLRDPDGYSIEVVPKVTKR